MVIDLESVANEQRVTELEMAVAANCIMSCTLCLLLRSNCTAAYTVMSQLAVIQEVPSVPAYAVTAVPSLFVSVLHIQ